MQDLFRRIVKEHEKKLAQKLHREGGCPGLASVRRLGAFVPVDARPLWLVHTGSFRLMLALFGLCAHRSRLNPQGGSWMVWGPSLQLMLTRRVACTLAS